MANYTIDPNMGFANPTPGEDPGPDYAINQSNTNTIIGAHNHSPGNGVPITPDGMNITTDLSFNSNNLLAVKTVNFFALSSPLAGLAPDLGCIYVAGNELYYNDEVGNVVQITNLGAVNSGAGSITGLPSGTASASYSSGNQRFVWQSATSTAADMDGGSVILREKIASANGVTLSSPLALAADYEIFFNAALPGAYSFLEMDTAGNISYTVPDNSTIEVSSGVLQVKAGGITNVQIAPGTITPANLGPLNYQVSPSTTSSGLTSATSYLTLPTFFGNFEVTITTGGRPVMLMIQSDGSGNDASILGQTSNASAYYRWFRDGTTNVGSGFMLLNNSGTYALFPNTFQMVDYSVSGVPGTYTYEFQMHTLGGQTVGIQYVVIFAYEM